MIKALLLIFDTEATWDRIVAAQRTISYVLFLFLVPFLVLTSAAEGYGLVNWGKVSGQIGNVRPIPLQQVLTYETGQLVLSILVVLAGARLLKSLGETFHGRHTFTQSFTVVAYGLSPLFLARIFNVIPIVWPLVIWGVGICLSIMILYHGVPRVMLPDPPHAFGLFVMCSVLLLMASGLERVVTMYYLAGKFPKVDDLVTQLLARFPHH
jgi:hypothetical protein